MRAYSGTLFQSRRHLSRLSESCAAIGKTLPLSTDKILKWLQDSLDECGARHAILRLSVHWGCEGAGTFHLFIREFKAYPEQIYRKGVSLKTAVSRRWTLRAQSSAIKSSQYLPGVLAELDRTANQADVRELVFLDATGFAAEGTVSNIFIVSSAKRILTPGVASGILKGISREIVMDLAREKGFEVLETFLTRHEIYSADECFMTNTSSEVLPVVSVDGRRIGNGKPGPVSKLLRKAFRRFVQTSRK